MRDRIRGWVRVIAALALVGAASTACSDDPGSPAAIEVDAPAALADQAVRIRITGLPPGKEVTVKSQTVDGQGKRWQGQATFRADTHGSVALDTARPMSGTYRGADGMGLFWSMVPRTGNPEHSFFYPPVSPRHAFDVKLTAAASGHRSASRTLTRKWFAAGVSSKKLTLAADKVSGELFLPAPGTPRHPAVLLFGGSEGGNSEVLAAALLASHGYPALAVGYFGLPGLPDTLENIPVEYFATAGRVLAAQSGVDPRHVLALGYSRGSEAALLLADRYPGLIHGAVVYSPSADVNGGFPAAATTAWTKGGKAIPRGPIPLDHVSGPVLAVAGEDDQLWSSPYGARQIIKELDADHHPYPHRALIFPKAGHGVGTFPYLAAGTGQVHPVTGSEMKLGGTRAGNAAAKEAGWRKVLALLASLEG